MRLSRLQMTNPWDTLHQVQSEVNRLVERFGGNGGWNRPFATAYPAVNVWEEADAVFVEAELPGLDANDLEIYVTGGNQLTLKGERKHQVPEQGVWHRQERGTGSFTRALTLPFPVDPENVEARFENGVLRVKLSKHEHAKPRKIDVKAQ